MPLTMSPFLPPHRQYDFGRGLSPPALIKEEEEDIACSSLLVAPPSPLPCFRDVDQEQELIRGGEDEVQSNTCMVADSDNMKADPDKKVDQAQSRSLSLRRRTTTSCSIIVRRSLKRESSATTTTTSKSPINTITLDRFSACIPCRRRKIKCIPRGDSHHYLFNGTNNGVCATCVRRKKDCFWPKIDMSTVTANRASPASPSQEVVSAPSGEDVEKMEFCEDDESEDSDKPTEKIKSNAEQAVTSPQIKQEDDVEVEVLPLKSPLPSAFGETHFAIPGYGFGRSVSTPGLSSSSSTASSSPVSPRTDASFLSPTMSESFFFDGKAVCHSPPPCTYLDSVQRHGSQAETQFADVYYGH